MQNKSIFGCTLEDGTYISETNPPNLGVLTALDWIKDKLQKIHGIRIPRNPPGWEFQLAMVVEFMRSACFLELPSPKRVLGLVCACDALRCCEESI